MMKQLKPKRPFVVVVMGNYNAGSVMYNGKSMLLQCLQTLQKTQYNNYKVVIADNSSTDNSLKIAKRFKNVEFLVKRTKEQYGAIPRTHNFGISYIMRHYGPKYILLHSTDILIRDGEWLSKLVKIAESDPKVGLVSCKLLYPTGRIQHAGMKVNFYPNNIGRGEVDKGQYDYTKSVDGVSGALVLIRTSMLNKIGLFDERFYNGFDDADLSIRVRKAGYKVIYEGKTSAIHLEGFASANSPVTAVRDRAFFGHQVAYVYHAYKNMNAIERSKAIMSCLVRSLLVYNVNPDPKAKNVLIIKFRDRKLWRLSVSFRAIFVGRRLYKEYLSSKNR